MRERQRARPHHARCRRHLLQQRRVARRVQRGSASRRRSRPSQEARGSARTSVCSGRPPPPSGGKTYASTRTRRRFHRAEPSERITWRRGRPYGARRLAAPTRARRRRQRPLAPSASGAPAARLASRGMQPARSALTANDIEHRSQEPRRLAARRAQVMAVAGRILDPFARLLRVKPEALAPNNAWALTGRRLIRSAIERERPDVVLATAPPPSALARHRRRGGRACRSSPSCATSGPAIPTSIAAARSCSRLQGARWHTPQAVVTVTDGCRDGLLRRRIRRSSNVSTSCRTASIPRCSNAARSAHGQQEVRVRSFTLARSTATEPRSAARRGTRDAPSSADARASSCSA